MIAVAPTDLDWFHQMRSGSISDNVNFWTPTPWNIRGLNPGDRFYFLLKAPYRKIGGFGEFREYLNLPVSAAWERFGQGNGVKDLDELVGRTDKYAEKRSELKRESADPTIGCIVLDNCQFLGDSELVDPASVGLDFPPTIVKLKYFDDDPMNKPTAQSSQFQALTDRAQIATCQETFARTLTAGSDRAENLVLGFQGGGLEAIVHWRSDLDMWMHFGEVENRYWTAFGLGNPFEGGPRSIVVEINSPFEGVYRRIGGVFLQDGSGAKYLAHRGRVGGGRRGIGQEAFMATIDPSRVVDFEDDGQRSKAILIGRLDAQDFSERVAGFVRDVRQFKTDAVEASSVWWVNQGQTYRAEREGGFIWAPQVDRSGRTLGHHRNVSLVKPGDVVLHYANGSVVAIGQIEAPPREAEKPTELGKTWDEQGWIAQVHYWDLVQPIELTEIPQELRAPGEGSAFNRNHAVNQGYLFALEEEIASAIRQTFSERWPLESPWFMESSKERPLHVLLKWKQSLDVSTIDRHKSIADELGSVWWGKFGAGKIASKKVDRLVSQIEKSVPTFAFLYRQGEVWRAELRHITTDPDLIPENRIPSYYSKDDCSAFFEISNFERLEPTWPNENLVLASKPDEPERMPGALGNQATPLFVFEKSPMTTRPIPIPEKIAGPTMEWLVEQTLWPEDRLEDLCRDIRTTSPQVVLAGPPGTSKTWVAKHVAKYLTRGNALATRTVQFHPSYGYEEFIQGLRPVVDEKLGGIRFDVVDGVVVKMANDIDDEEQIHVLVIDEMNRANLPRVFGELMYLFEYREQDEAIDLQYSSDFSLPSNLKFIGTMNTADRSIRSIDIALRRRFEVFECPPDRGILERFYENGLGSNHIPSLFDGSDKLNERLEAELDRHHTIGHTFFMAKDLSRERLRKVWDRKLGPLIDEYFFDQPDIASEFSPEEFWPELQAE